MGIARLRLSLTGNSRNSIVSFFRTDKQLDFSPLMVHCVPDLKKDALLSGLA